VFANDINEVNTIVGSTFTIVGMERAFIKTASGSLRELGTLGGESSYATSVNESNTFVGYSKSSDGQNSAFIATENGAITDLGRLPNGISSFAYSINDSGVVVGKALTSDNKSRAVLWLPDGTIIDLDAWLNQVNPTSGPRWTLTEALDINSNGLIVGNGTSNASTRAFVLDASTLVPEPGSLAALGIAAFALLSRRPRTLRQRIDPHIIHFHVRRV
jgi:probable HAF family extracellular repeat protein